MEQQQQSQAAEEMKKMEYEPLLPAEMSLIRWSIGIGIVALVALYWLSRVLFPGTH